MNRLTEIFVRNIENFLKFFLAHLTELGNELWHAKNGIPAKNLARDIADVVLSVGMLLFLHTAALFVFLFLPQGKDVILIVAEEVGVSHRVSSLLWLLIGVLLWSVVSEYASRYAIYVTDHSGKNLTNERVIWRKVLQKVMSELFLMFPYFIVLLGFIVNYLNDTSLTGIDKNIGFGIPALLIYMLLNIVARFYFNRQRDEWRAKPNWFQKIMLLPAKEKEMCERLYGIYNDYVFSIRKPGNFVGETKDAASKLAEKFLSLPENERINFPKNAEMVNPENTVPSEFKFQKFDDEPQKSGGYFRWTYKIPNSFYKTLHTQLLLIVLTCVFIFLVVCFLPVHVYGGIGSPGLLILSFTCWSGIYLGVIYLDFAVFRMPERDNMLNRFTRNISVRAILPLLLIFSSFANKDHEIRYTRAQAADNRPLQEQHFQSWFDNYRKDSTATLFMNRTDSTAFFPVTFVCAEGGALRTGAFAALTLSYLQDSLVPYRNIDFKKSIYAFSGVSGGSLGISFFNSVACLDTYNHTNAYYSRLTHEFFKQDFLAPVIGKMFYGDILNLFVPWQIERFDRAIALENAWEEGYENTITSNHDNFFSKDVLRLYGRNHRLPALYINTTEVETGRQCWLTNVRPASSMIKSRERDVIAYRLGGGIRYSTMINFSTRFPLFSPAATVVESNSRKYHFVDGGYYENTGMATMKEVISALVPVIIYYKSIGVNIQPNVLVLRFSENDEHHTNLNFANELSEVLLGIYNTRAGRAEVAENELIRLVEGELGGNVATLRLSMSSSQVPMNWVLSQTSLNNIHKDIREKWTSRSNNDLRKLFFVNNALFRPFKTQSRQ